MTDTDTEKEPVVLIKCESLSSQSEHRRGYHKYQTTVEGYNAERYAPIEFEHLKKQSMWCEMKQEGNRYTIRHGYDSGD